MMSLEGPSRKEYSEEESKLIKHKLIILLYIFLIIYLTLHQFLIPLVNNLFKGNYWASDIHFTFLMHFYGYYKLSKDKVFKAHFYSFLWMVTILEVVVGATNLDKWGLFSLALTQVSTIIFLYFVYPFVENVKKVWWIVASLVVATVFFLGMKSVEVKSQKTKKLSERRVLLHQEDFSVSFPGNYPLQRELSLWSLGNQALTYNKNFKLFNDQEQVIDIRLYEVKVSSPERLTFKFNRLAQLKAGESWDLPLENDRLYLIKSPERKDLKVLLLIPQGYRFILGSGDLSIGFNTLSWRKHE